MCRLQCQLFAVGSAAFITGRMLNDNGEAFAEERSLADKRLVTLGINALAEGGGVLRQVGHDAIFAMHAIKAFRMLPETATPERVDGVRKLIRAFTPWRDVEPDERVQSPVFSDEVAASRFILKEASDAIDRFVGFGQGFAGHMLTFGQSLVELAAMGNIRNAVFHEKRLFLFPSADQKKEFQAHPDEYAKVDLALDGKSAVCKVEINKDVTGIRAAR